MKVKFVRESLITEKFSSVENMLRMNLEWSNKPKDLSEVNDVVVTPDIQNKLNKLKQAETYILDQKCSNLIPARLQERIFICNGEDGNTYLINPEGFNFPYFVVRLVNVQNESQFNRSNSAYGSNYPLQKIQYESIDDVEELDNVEEDVIVDDEYENDLEVDDENIESDDDLIKGIDASDMENEDEIKINDDYTSETKIKLDAELNVKEFNREEILFKVLSDHKRIISGIVMAKLDENNYIFRTNEGMKKFNIKDIIFVDDES
jgi:hypothetical protein